MAILYKSKKNHRLGTVPTLLHKTPTQQMLLDGPTRRVHAKNIPKQR